MRSSLYGVCCVNGVFSINTILLILAFIGATRAFLIIESLLYLGIGGIVYFTVYHEHHYPSAAAILTFLIGILICFHLCTFLYYDSELRE